LEALVTLTPDVRPEDTERVAREIERRLGLRARPDPLKPVRRLRVVVEGPEDVDALRRKFPEVSRVILVRAEGSSPDLETVVERAREAVRGRIRPDETFAVDARRLDKTLPYTSRDLARAVGDAVREETGASVDLDNPDRYVDVHVSGEGFLIGVTPATLREPSRRWLPADAFRHVYVCCERPELEYEIADLIRVTAALGLGGLILVRPRVKSLERARGKVGAASLVDLRVVDELERAVEGFDVVVGLHPTGSEGEERLVRLARSGERVCLLVGSEREGLSRRAKRLADALVHLGPTTAEPMRTANAVAYAVGVLAGAAID
jgi:tRNA acetyltransferase TAN1